MESYAFKYAVIQLSDGMCRGVADDSAYILDPTHVPIEDDTLAYYRKYYHPIPETVTSHDDFQGKWYTDNTYQTEWTPA